MCYFIILRNKDTPLIEKKKSNKCNLAISNTEKHKKQNISYPENTSQSTHAVFFKNGLSRTPLLITFDS